MLATHPSYTSALDQAKSASTTIFDFLNSHLSILRNSQKAPTIGYLARHLFFYGDKHGNRSPIADPNMRGAIVGLSMDSSIDDLALQYYSAMEFIAQQTRHIIDVLNKSGHSVTSIFVSGGQCKNPLLVGLIADATGLPVAIPRYIQDAVVLGAAMLGAKAASADESGKTEDLWGIINRMSQGGSVVYPTSDGNVKRLLEAKYEVETPSIVHRPAVANHHERFTCRWRGHSRSIGIALMLPSAVGTEGDTRPCIWTSTVSYGIRFIGITRTIHNNTGCIQ